MSTVSREMLAAGVGCAAANGSLNSFETTKVKLQLRDPARPVYRTPTMLGVVRQVAAEDGLVRGLMAPGLSASAARSLAYGAFRVGLYPSVRARVADARDREPRLRELMAAGMLTGGVGAALSCPLDVVRTRMQGDSGTVRAGAFTTGLRAGQRVRYPNMVRAFASIARDEGWRGGLYRGAGVTVARATLLNGAQLATYDALKRRAKRRGGWREGAALHAACALASGVVAQTVVMPFDVVKSHLMQGRGGWRAVRAGVHAHGPGWLFRGILPACAGQGLIMVLQMPLIEELRRLLGVAAI